MMKRCLSLLLVVGLIAVLAVPVSADEGNKGSWTDLLEFASVQPDGSNLVKLSGTEGTFEILVNPQRRVSKVDLLFSYGNGSLPSYIGVNYAGSLTKLTVVDLGNNLARAYGNITYTFYPALSFTVRKTGTGDAFYDLLSCKVAAVSSIDTKAQGKLYRSFSDPSPLTLPNNFKVSGTGAETTYEYKLIPVIISDWRKYDSITIFGSITSMALNSFRASIGTKGLPYTISYMESIPTSFDGESWTDYQYNSHTETTYLPEYDPEIHDETSFEDGAGIASGGSYATVSYGGAVLYTITIDLTGVDRSVSENMDCYFTCIADPGIGYAFNVQDVSGSVVTADTTTVSWWNRFTSFMTDLFGAKEDSGALDDLGDSSNSISSNTDQIHGFEQSQQAVLDNNFAQIQSAVTFTNFAAALVFVQKYANMTFNGISKYAIVFTLPLFLGLFFYLCSRIPGITRWKTPPPRSPSPKSKGGGKT